MAELEDVERRLETAVARSRARVGAALTEDAEKLIEAYVARAASELVESAREEQDFDRAVQAFDELFFHAAFRTERSADEAPPSDRRGRRIVTGRQLRVVLDKLCPGFWPFC